MHCIESKKGRIAEEEEVIDKIKKSGREKIQRSATMKEVVPLGSKVNKDDFILFNQTKKKMNKENQRILGSFGIEKMAMFFIKYRVDRNSINDENYQKLIHQCYNFLVNYVKNNFENQIKVHDNLEIFLRDIDKNPLICLLIYELFKDNKKFLTLNVSKILRHIILSAEYASL